MEALMQTRLDETFKVFARNPRPHPGCSSLGLSHLTSASSIVSQIPFEDGAEWVYCDLCGEPTVRAALPKRPQYLFDALPQQDMGIVEHKPSPRKQKLQLAAIFAVAVLVVAGLYWMGQ